MPALEIQSLIDMLALDTELDRQAGARETVQSFIDMLAL
jgi:hypothetical protein